MNPQDEAMSMVAGMPVGKVRTFAALVSASLPPTESSMKVGDYLFFQDTDGSLKVRAPDMTVVTLVVKT